MEFQSITVLGTAYLRVNTMMKVHSFIYLNIFLKNKMLHFKLQGNSGTEWSHYYKLLSDVAFGI